MSDKLNFDTLDILAAAVGALIALLLLPSPADRGTERIVVPLCALALVTLKRRLVPTLETNPDSSPFLRLLYLLIALIGTALLGFALIDTVFAAGMVHDVAYRKYFIVGGLLLLLVSFVIDRRYLKLT